MFASIVCRAACATRIRRGNCGVRSTGNGRKVTSSKSTNLAAAVVTSAREDSLYFQKDFDAAELSGRRKRLMTQM